MDPLELGRGTQRDGFMDEKGEEMQRRGDEMGKAEMGSVVREYQKRGGLPTPLCSLAPGKSFDFLLSAKLAVITKGTCASLKNFRFSRYYRK